MRRRPAPTSTTSLARDRHHTAKVYLDGSNARLQVLDRLAERNVYVSEDGAWIYGLRVKQAATHVTVDRAALEALEGRRPRPTPTRRAAQLEAELGAPLPTPDEVLDQALAKLDETTEVSVGTDARVAGREVYELVLEPQDADTLVGEVSVAIDGETGVPLAASVTARGADEPAFSVAFTDVSFEAPDASVFAFTPPEGTDGDRARGADPDRRRARAVEGRGARPVPASGPRGCRGPRCIGEGWSTVVELPAGARPRPSGQGRRRGWR